MNGMTRLDHFACAALVSLREYKPGFEKALDTWTKKGATEQAYALAREMIQERRLSRNEDNN